MLCYHRYNCQEILGDIKNSIQPDGSLTLGITAGRSPLEIYSKLSELNINFSLLKIILLDERIVPPTSNDSNYKTISNYFLSLPNFNPDNFLNFYNNDHIDYDFTILKYSAISSIDFAIIGLGEDGHICGFFQNDFCSTSKLISINNNSPKLPKMRISVTPTFINQRIKRVILLALGEEKNDILKTSSQISLDYISLKKINCYI